MIGRSPTLSHLNEPQPLTPSHLLQGRRMTTLPYPHENMDNFKNYENVTHHSLNQRFRTQQLILEHFWTRWKKEYLTSLKEHQVGTTGKNDQNVKVGDVVLIHDEGPRISWKLAKIEELIRGKDGIVRAVNLRTKHGMTNQLITKLYPIEVNDNQSIDNIPTERMSKIKAKDKIHGWTH